MYKWATIEDVRVPFVFKDGTRRVSVDLYVDYDADNSCILSFEVFVNTSKPHRGYVTHTLEDNTNAFNQMWNILHLFKCGDVCELKGANATLMIGTKGIAISTDRKRRWVVCMANAPCDKGVFYTKAQAENWVN